jgi:hypothetical protein
MTAFNPREIVSEWIVTSSPDGSQAPVAWPWQPLGGSNCPVPAQEVLPKTT